MAAVIIEVIAWAAGHLVGVVLATLGIIIISLVTVRIHPRVRHVGWAPATAQASTAARSSAGGIEMRSLQRRTPHRMGSRQLRLRAHPIRVRAQQAGQGRSERRKPLAVSLPLADWVILAVLTVMVALSAGSRRHPESPQVRGSPARRA